MTRFLSYDWVVNPHYYFNGASFHLYRVKIKTSEGNKYLKTILSENMIRKLQGLPLTDLVDDMMTEEDIRRLLMRDTITKEECDEIIEYHKQIKL